MDQEELNKILPREKQIELMQSAKDRSEKVFTRMVDMLNDPDVVW